jgi:DedD protein
MDRRVKERLIGASILVALIVLVVPELLSGPKSAVPATPPAMFPANAPEPTRNVTLDLATSKAPANSEIEPADTQGSAASAVSAARGEEASRVAPAPASPSAGSSSTAAPPTAAPATAESATAAPATAAPAAAATATAPTTLKPVETAAQSPISAHANWAVQLGSFASRANADNLSRQLKGQGFSVYVLPGGSSTSVRYRVRVGPLADRDSAERMAAKLKSIGHASSLVAPAG